MISHGVNGLLCPAGDTSAFTSALGELVSSREQRSALGKQARETIRQRFDISLTQREYEALYERLLTTRRDLRASRGNATCP